MKKVKPPVLIALLPILLLITGCHMTYTVKGCVTFEDGKPLTVGSVMLESGSWSCKSELDSKGHYSMKGVPENTKYKVYVLGAVKTKHLENGKEDGVIEYRSPRNSVHRKHPASLVMSIQEIPEKRVGLSHSTLPYPNRTMNKNDSDTNRATLEMPRSNILSAGLDRIRGRLVGIHKTDVICIALAILALAVSVPFYAFNRSTENVASFHCQALFRYIPESVAAGSAEAMLQLKQQQLKFLDEGLPSGIWCFSWTLILLTIWQGSNHCRTEQIFWCSLPLVLNTLWEVFQELDLIGGSGTGVDIVFGVAGSMLALSVLNDEQRPYFGLDPIDPHWDEVEIKPDFTVFFEEETIKKVISHFQRRDVEYKEYDTILPTRERQFVLAKTAKGKEKKLNFTSIDSVTPTGCIFTLRYGSEYNDGEIWAINPRNGISLPIRKEVPFKSLEDYVSWRNEYIATCPDGYFEKVDRMRNSPHQTIKYFNGDIFRFEIDREHYGFGIVIGQIAKMRKDDLLPKDHTLNHVMTVPLLVRYYKIMTKNRDLPLDEILASPLLPAEIISDNHLIWGVAKIVGSKKLKADDIDFPMHAGYLISSKTDEKRFRFCWGLGMFISKPDGDYPILWDSQSTYINHLDNNAVSVGIDPDSVIREFRRESPHRPWGDICHPKYADAKEKVFRFLGIPNDTSLDEFNLKYNGMTRQKYADYANKYVRKASNNNK